MKTIEHYQTHRLINRISANDNDAACINPSIYQYESEPVEPRSIKDSTLIEDFEKLFDRGFDIYLETNQGYDDEGRDCYIAYLIKPEHKEQADAYHAENYERNGEMRYNLTLMEYLLKYPDHFIQIWAGPY